jgi:hypothetical protein
LLALLGVLADGDIEIRHVGVEGSTHPAVANVELGAPDGSLGSLKARVEFTELGE